jgi:von Willebrand factor/Domain of unknown function (DUF3520)
VDDSPNPLEDRPFSHELSDVLRSAVQQTFAETPPAGSLSRALQRARRLGTGEANPWLRYHRAATAAAVAAVLFLAFGLLLICWHYEPGTGPRNVEFGANHPLSPVQNEGGESVAVFVDHGPERVRPDGSAGDGRAEAPFLDAATNPTSTFPLSVDVTAYSDMRRALLEQKRLPIPGAVRVAGLVNAFNYSYPEPAKGESASLTLDLAQCPWNAAHHLARIGVRARSDAAVLGAEVLVAFNSRRVSAYRLIGYEGRRARESDAIGETLGAGQALTALYEVVPADDTDKGEWLTVKIRYQGANGLLSRSLLGESKNLTEASADFRLAAAAAEFGLLLRESEYRGVATYDAVRIAARASLGMDADGRRAEFLAMVDAADRLSVARKLVRGI